MGNYYVSCDGISRQCYMWTIKLRWTWVSLWTWGILEAHWVADDSDTERGQTPSIPAYV